MGRYRLLAEILGVCLILLALSFPNIIQGVSINPAIPIFGVMTLLFFSSTGLGGAFIISFCVASLSIFMIGSLAFKNGSMENAFRWISIASLILTVIMFNLNKIKTTLNLDKKCKCGKTAKDEIGVGKEKSHFCRNHLSAGFARLFCESKAKMAVFYPNLEGQSGTFIYAFNDYDEIRKMDLEAEAGDLIRNSIPMIVGSCAECTESASVAYFGKETIKWKEDNSGIRYPDFQSIREKPEILCKRCAAEKIIPSLKGYKNDFYEPIQLPKKGDEGAMFALEI